MSSVIDMSDSYQRCKSKAVAHAYCVLMRVKERKSARKKGQNKGRAEKRKSERKKE